MGCFWQQPIQKGFAAGDVTIKKKSGSQTAALQKSALLPENNSNRIVPVRQGFFDGGSVSDNPTNRDLKSVYYIIFSYELAPSCFIRAGEGPIEIGCRADQCEMRERLRKVSEMLAVRPKFL